jgi:hypothetical protein
MEQFLEDQRCLSAIIIATAQDFVNNSSSIG